MARSIAFARVMADHSGSGGNGPRGREVSDERRPLLPRRESPRHGSSHPAVSFLIGKSRGELSQAKQSLADYGLLCFGPASDDLVGDFIVSGLGDDFASHQKRCVTRPKRAHRPAAARGCATSTPTKTRG